MFDNYDYHVNLLQKIVRKKFKPKFTLGLKSNLVLTKESLKESFCKLYSVCATTER